MSWTFVLTKSLVAINITRLARHEPAGLELVPPSSLASALPCGVTLSWSHSLSEFENPCLELAYCIKLPQQKKSIDQYVQATQEHARHQ